MYGISTSIDLSFLVGRELIQVCYGQYQVCLHLTGDIAITVEGDYEISLMRGDDRARSRCSASALQPDAINCNELLGRTVVSVEVLDERTVVVRFTERATLTLYDSNKSHESFEIVSSDQRIIV